MVWQSQCSRVLKDDRLELNPSFVDLLRQQHTYLCSLFVLSFLSFLKAKRCRFIASYDSDESEIFHDEHKIHAVP